MPETLYGTDAITYHVLEKVELAARRMGDNDKIGHGEGWAFKQFAETIHKMLKEMRE